MFESVDLLLNALCSSFFINFLPVGVDTPVSKYFPFLSLSVTSRLLHGLVLSVAVYSNLMVLTCMNLRVPVCTAFLFQVHCC